MTPLSSNQPLDMHSTIALRHRGEGWGVLGVLAFSLTLPFTRWIVAEIDPTLVALARAVVAGALAATVLAITGAPRPRGAQWRALAIVSLGVVFGFPIASSWAMHTLPASHGAIVNALLPLATALAAAVRFGERPSRRFWAWAAIGSAVVVAFAAYEAHRTGQRLGLQPGDAWMLVAVALAAIGYAEGGVLSQRLGSWQTICWALVVSQPLLVPIVLVLGAHEAPRIAHASAHAWVGFAYVSLFSMFLGFFAWYRGLALGGVARVGQIQLLQLFFTLAFSALVFGEHVPPSTWLFAVVVLGCVMAGRRAPITRRL